MGISQYRLIPCNRLLHWPVTAVYLNKFSFTVIESTFAGRGASYRTNVNATREIEMAACLLQAIDDTLEMLGQKAGDLVYGYLQKSFGLMKDEIPARPEVFSRGLFSLFGSASKHLEMNIVKKFYEKLGIAFEPTENFNFLNCILVVETTR